MHGSSNKQGEEVVLMAILKFAHVGLNCNDIDVTERFYVKHFGFQRTRVLPVEDGKIVFVKSGDIYLELFQSKGNPPGQNPEKDGPGYVGFRHIAFQVDDVDAKIREMGDDARVTLGPFSFDDFIKGWKTAWIKDPDGRIVEISQGYRD